MPFLRILAATALGIGILVSTLEAAQVYETRALTFEKGEPGLGWPNKEYSFLGGLIEAEFFLWEAGALTFHIASDLDLRYESCDVHPPAPGTDQLVDLDWTLLTKDGPGREYEREAGIKAALDIKLWSPEVKFGYDFEGNFAAPYSGNSVSMLDFLGVLSWAKNCIGGVDAGTVYQEEVHGDRYNMVLEIVSPSNGVEWTNGSKFLSIDFTSPQLTTQLKITSAYLGQDIEIRANSPFAFFTEKESMSVWMSIYSGICLTDTPGEAVGVFPWFVPSGASSLTIFYDNQESDDLRWTLHAIALEDVDDCLQGGSSHQDLTLDAVRVSPEEYPIPSQTDQIAVQVTNREGYGDPCLEYSSVTVTYSLDAGEMDHPVPIGAQTYTSLDQPLIDFNSGITNQLDFLFDYTEASPEYYFQPERSWETRPHPFYLVELSVVPDLAGSDCPGWLDQEDVRNNRRVLPFKAPLPEFAVSGVSDLCIDTDGDSSPDRCQIKGNLCSSHAECFNIYDGQPFFPGEGVIGEACINSACQFSGYSCQSSGDCTDLSFDLRVSNLGVSWPPLGAVVQPVEISGRLVLEKDVAGTWTPVMSTLVDVHVVPGLGAGASQDFNFQYQVNAALLPPDYERARFVFEVNGPDLMGNRTVSERSYLNNEHEITLYRHPSTMTAVPEEVVGGSGCERLCIDRVEGTRVFLEIAETVQVTERIYDLRGRLVASLGTQRLSPGTFTRVWDQRGTDGRRVARGVYFYEASVPGDRAGTKLLLFR